MEVMDSGEGTSHNVEVWIREIICVCHYLTNTCQNLK